jgi:hypothetical protein
LTIRAHFERGTARPAAEYWNVDELQRILDEDAGEVARRVIERHKFGRLSDRRIITLLRSQAEASGVRGINDRQLLDLWFSAFARHVEQLRRPHAS